MGQPSSESTEDEGGAHEAWSTRRRVWPSCSVFRSGFLDDVVVGDLVPGAGVDLEILDAVACLSTYIEVTKEELGNVACVALVEGRFGSFVSF